MHSAADAFAALHLYLGPRYRSYCAGTKADVVKAYTSGLLTLQTSGTAASADVVETFNLQHWLQSNALYGMEYEQVTNMPRKQSKQRLKLLL